MSRDLPSDADEGDEIQLTRQCALGGAIRRLRKADEAGPPLWSRAELAARAGLNEEYLDQLERGEVNPTMAVICRLADGLDAPVTLLMRDLDRLASRPGA